LNPFHEVAHDNQTQEKQRRGTFDSVNKSDLLLAPSHALERIKLSQMPTYHVDSDSQTGSGGISVRPDAVDKDIRTETVLPSTFSIACQDSRPKKLSIYDAYGSRQQVDDSRFPDSPSAECSNRNFVRDLLTKTLTQSRVNHGGPSVKRFPGDMMNSNWESRSDENSIQNSKTVEDQDYRLPVVVSENLWPSDQDFRIRIPDCQITTAILHDQGRMLERLGLSPLEPKSPVCLDDVESGEKMPSGYFHASHQTLEVTVLTGDGEKGGSGGSYVNKSPTHSRNSSMKIMHPAEAALLESPVGIRHDPVTHLSIDCPEDVQETGSNVEKSGPERSRSQREWKKLESSVHKQVNASEKQTEKNVLKGGEKERHKAHERGNHARKEEKTIARNEKEVHTMRRSREDQKGGDRAKLETMGTERIRSTREEMKRESLVRKQVNASEKPTEWKILKGNEELRHKAHEIGNRARKEVKTNVRSEKEVYTVRSSTEDKNGGEGAKRGNSARKEVKKIVRSEKEVYTMRRSPEDKNGGDGAERGNSSRNEVKKIVRSEKEVDTMRRSTKDKNGGEGAERGNSARKEVKTIVRNEKEVYIMRRSREDKMGGDEAKLDTVIRQGAISDTEAIDRAHQHDVYEKGNVVGMKSPAQADLRDLCDRNKDLRDLFDKRKAAEQKDTSQVPQQTVHSINKSSSTEQDTRGRELQRDVNTRRQADVLKGVDLADLRNLYEAYSAAGNRYLDRTLPLSVHNRSDASKAENEGRMNRPVDETVTHQIDPRRRVVENDNVTRSDQHNVFNRLCDLEDEDAGGVQRDDLYKRHDALDDENPSRIGESDRCPRLKVMDGDVICEETDLYNGLRAPNADNLSRISESERYPRRRVMDGDVDQKEDVNKRHPASNKENPSRVSESDRYLRHRDRDGTVVDREEDIYNKHRASNDENPIRENPRRIAVDNDNVTRIDQRNVFNRLGDVEDEDTGRVQRDLHDRLGCLDDENSGRVDESNRCPRRRVMDGDVDCEEAYLYNRQRASTDENPSRIIENERYHKRRAMDGDVDREEENVYKRHHALHYEQPSQENSRRRVVENENVTRIDQRNVFSRLGDVEDEDTGRVQRDLYNRRGGLDDKNPGQVDENDRYRDMEGDVVDREEHLYNRHLASDNINLSSDNPRHRVLENENVTRIEQRNVFSRLGDVEEDAGRVPRDQDDRHGSFEDENPSRKDESNRYIRHWDMDGDVVDREEHLYNRHRASDNVNLSSENPRRRAVENVTRIDQRNVFNRLGDVEDEGRIQRDQYNRRSSLDNENPSREDETDRHLDMDGDVDREEYLDDRRRGADQDYAIREDTQDDVRDRNRSENQERRIRRKRGSAREEYPDLVLPRDLESNRRDEAESERTGCDDVVQNT